ncbi:hypothetical protein [Flavobacterium subsaxonicum]|uniref:Uncharacterized protein n=1 Tax=Flavobacterium subsaxonicum WB 4.1-42 = DSM 21790 TaxID=1121898 RepID=A0A0A2MV63_9FLAO|nr:hypothetical protein [Flavobacterium subsaxonicum]KGO92105.1 hypothetical protein Q766_14530 [Flavobacterium subsaxonicum WB 4.1-42 = DSM 21790]
MNKKQSTLVLIAFGIFLIFIGFQFYTSKQESKIIASKNLQLSGKITTIQKLKYGHEFGYLFIDIKKSNYNFIDERDTDNDYSFIIKNGKCLLVISGLLTIKPGDDIKIDKDKYSIYRNGKVIIDQSNIAVLPRYLYDDPSSLLLSK